MLCTSARRGLPRRRSKTKWTLVRKERVSRLLDVYAVRLSGNNSHSVFVTSVSMILLAILIIWLVPATFAVILCRVAAAADERHDAATQRRYSTISAKRPRGGDTPRLGALWEGAPRSRRRGRSGPARGRMSLETVAGEDVRDGTQHDLDVLPQRPVRDVQIVDRHHLPERHA